MSLRNAATKGAGLSGAKIRVEKGLWLKADSFSPSFTQTLHMFIPQGQNEAIEFVASREVVGKFTISGSYPADNAKELSVIKSGTILTDTILRLDNDVSYTGDVIFESISTKVSTQNKDIPYTASCRFTGLINSDDTDSESIDSGSVGSTRFGKRAGDFSERATIGYQDNKQDRFSRPFIIQGFDENTVSVEDAVNNAVQTLADTTKNQKGPTSDQAFLQTGIGRDAGRGVVIGTFLYGRGPRDCTPNAASVSIGKTMQGFIAEDIVGSGSSGDSGNICDAEGLGTQIRRYYNRAVALNVYRVPGVWDTDPSSDATLLAMIGFINNATYVINSNNKVIGSVRFDGAETQAYKSPSGTYWSGNLIFVEMFGGWLDGKLVCTRWVNAPLQGTQTVAGYLLESSSIQLFRYAKRPFADLDTLIPGCGY